MLSTPVMLSGDKHAQYILSGERHDQYIDILASYYRTLGGNNVVQLLLHLTYELEKSNISNYRYQ